MENLKNNFSNFHEQIALMDNHDEIVDYYIEYRNYLISINPEQALLIIKEGYFKYENNKNKDYKYTLLANWAYTLIVMEHFNEALEKLLICLKYFLKKNDRENITINIGNTASIFIKLELYSYAMYLWRVILNNYIDPQNKYIVNLTMSNIMMINMVIFHKIDFNIEVIQDLIHYYSNQEKMSPNDLYIYLFAYHNEARYYKLKKDYTKAIQILEKLLQDYEYNNLKIEKIDVYLDLGILYKIINNEDKMVFCFKNVIHLGNELDLKLHFSEVYNELYEFYKRKNDYIKALKSLEKFSFYKEKEIELKNSISTSLKELGIHNKYFTDNSIHNIFNNDNKENDKFFFCEDLEGHIMKINAMDIIFIKNEIVGIKIFLSNNEQLYIKGLFKKFVKQLFLLFPESTIFFEANARDTLFNLFWISKISHEDKIVYLRPFHNEIPISLSKRKWVDFKNLLKI